MAQRAKKSQGKICGNMGSCDGKEREEGFRIIEEATQLCLLDEIEDAPDERGGGKKRDERFMTLGGRYYRTFGIVTNIDDGEDESLYAMVCKIVRHGRGTILKIWSGDRGSMLFAHAEKRLFELRCLL